MLRIQNNLPAVIPAPQTQHITIAQKNLCTAIYAVVARMMLAIQSFFMRLFYCAASKPPTPPAITNPTFTNPLPPPQPPIIPPPPPVIPPRPPVIPPRPPIDPPRPPVMPRPPIDPPRPPVLPRPPINEPQPPIDPPQPQVNNLPPIDPNLDPEVDRRYNILVYPNPVPYQRIQGQHPFPELEPFPNIRATFDADRRNYYPLRALTQEELEEYEDLIISGGAADPQLIDRRQELLDQQDDFSDAVLEEIRRLDETIALGPIRLRFFQRRVQLPGELTPATVDAARGFEHDLRGLRQRPPLDVGNEDGDLDNIDIDNLMDIFNATYPGDNSDAIQTKREHIQFYVEFIKNPPIGQPDIGAGIDAPYIVNIQRNARLLIDAIRKPDVLLDMKKGIFDSMEHIIVANWCNPRRAEEISLIARSVNEGKGPVFRGWNREDAILFHSIIRWKATDENHILQRTFGNDYHFINHVRNSPVAEEWGLDFSPNDDWAARLHERPIEIYRELLADQYTTAWQIREITARFENRVETAKDGLLAIVNRLYPEIAADFLYLITEDQTDIFYREKIINHVGAPPERLLVSNEQFTAFVLENYGFITRQGQNPQPTPPQLPPVQIKQLYIDNVEQMDHEDAIGAREELNEQVRKFTAHLREPRWNAHFRAWFQRILDIANAKLAIVNQHIADLPDDDEVDNEPIAPPPVVQNQEPLTPEQIAEIEAMDRENVDYAIERHAVEIANARTRAANRNLLQPQRERAQRQVNQADARLAALQRRLAALPG